MAITITRSIDIEYTIKSALDNYLTAYCRPLPPNFSTPCILVTQVGGDSKATSAGVGKIDTFMVVLDSRAETEAEAFEYLRNAVAILEKISAEQGTEIAHVEVNTAGSWGSDPVRPDLAMCSATLMVTAHRENVTI